MFGFFKSRTPQVTINDKIWMSSSAKWLACRNMLEINESLIFVAWFAETQKFLLDYLGQQHTTNVMLASQLSSSNTNPMLVFVEHYPLSTVEQELFIRLNLNNVPVLSALDEPLFLVFGGERTIKLMKELGMEEGEVLGHSMITKSIRRAQSKVARSVAVEQKAKSQAEWFTKNLR